MRLHTLPVHRGLRVPHVVRWTGEEDISPAVVNAGGVLRYVDPIVDAACRWQGTLWRRHARAQGKGTPIFEALHPVRQRRAMWEQLCQVCDGPTLAEAARHGGALYLVGASDDSGTVEPIQEGERTENPPVHIACAWESVGHCRYLLEGYTAARVARPVQWGIGGVLHMPSGRAVVPLPQRVELAHGTRELRWMLAERAVAQLRGVTPIDLVAEAERAGLLAEGGRR
ncbi:hypothetical protein HHL19_16515 [Streptomyces sp. R302]|uniref:hypothetical protein n=1 Tax=unclassified Streptomyces TaxID=2593676 RepID=UPI00145F7090|nr:MULTISPECIES: hypothetical protein [unclassified Streptomyces]NML55373.1 hypothetical protein [Streptomyces sp. R301]NML80245.1 hypothetical protein [Streptomyces sp. R302]